MTKFLFVVGLLSATSGISSANVIFSTSGTATPGFFPSNGAVSNSSVFHAFQFTVAAGNGGVLDELVVAGLSSGAFTETFRILSDNAGGLGSVLATIPIPVSADGVSRLYSAHPATSLTLVAGTTYWIEAASPSGSDWFEWLQADPIVTATEYSSARTGTFPGQPSEAFALLDAPPPSATPEPATWLLALSCLLPFAGSRSRRNGKRAKEPNGKSAYPRSM
jgi:hypothetical protein